MSETNPSKTAEYLYTNEAGQTIDIGSMVGSTIQGSKTKNHIQYAQEALTEYNTAQLMGNTRTFQDDALGLTDANRLTGSKSGLVSVQLQDGKESIKIDLNEAKEQLARAQANTTNSSSAMAQLEMISYLQKNGSDRDGAIAKVEELSQQYGSLTGDDLSNLLSIQENYANLQRQDAQDPDGFKSADNYLSSYKNGLNAKLEIVGENQKQIDYWQKRVNELETAQRRNDQAIQNVSVYPESEEGINAGPPYMKMITDKSSEEEKVILSDFQNELSDGYVSAKNGTFLKYVKNPEFYTNTAGRIFVDSDNAYQMLKKWDDDPQKQRDHVQAAQDILGDPDKSYEIDPNNPKFKSPNDEVLTLGNRKFGLPADANYTDKQKKTIQEWKDNGLVTKQDQAAVDEKAKTPDVKPPEETPKEEIVPEDYNKKQFMKIANHDDVPYERVNGYNKIRFPKTWAGKYAIDIMGLPPTRIQQNPITPLISSNAFDLVTPGIDEIMPNMYVYNEDEQLKKSFLKLTINPIDVEFVNGMNGDKPKEQTDTEKKLSTNRSSVIKNIEYNFAIQMNSQMTFNHQNSYGPSGFENIFGGMFQGISDAVSQFSGLSQVTGGIDEVFKDFGGFANSAASTAKQASTQIRDTLLEGAKKTFGDKSQGYKDAEKFTNAISNLTDVGLERLSGGRIDLPDIWNGSQTNIQHSFTIELRSMNPDPLSDQYFKDIILPLYVLMTLSLPTDTSGIVYKTPPYITCNVDQVFEIRLGAITNISIDPHLEELNMKRAPRHITVQISVRDLYSVMKQKAYDKKNDDKAVGKENQDTTDKDTFVSNLVKYAESEKGKPTTNEPYYLTEFSKIPAYMSALEAYKNEHYKNSLLQLAESAVNALTKLDKKSISNIAANMDKIAQAAKEGADKVVQLKDGNFITSIGNVITGVTKGVKNIVSGVQKAIQPVRNLINTGKMVMNSVNGLKASVKLIGQTANLENILNGKFASSVGFAFSNLANATDVVQSISNGCINGKGLNGIVNAISNVPQAVLTNNIANCITDTGAINLSDQVRDSACSMYALANMFGSTYANVVGLENLASNGGSILDKAQSLFENLGGIANGIEAFTIGQSATTTTNTVTIDPIIQRYVSNMTQGMVDKGITTANSVSSNTKLQNAIQESSNTAVKILTDPNEITNITNTLNEAEQKAFEAMEKQYLKKYNGDKTKAKTMATISYVINQNLG